MFKSKPRPTFQEKIRLGEIRRELHLGWTGSMFELFVEIDEIPQSQSFQCQLTTGNLWWVLNNSLPAEIE